MNKYLNYNQDLDILDDIIELTNDWIFIFSLDQTLIKAYISEPLKQSIERDFINCLSSHQQENFHRFFELVKYSSKKVRESFVFNVNDERFYVELTGRMKEDFVLINGNVKPHLEEIRIIAEELPLPAFSISRKGVLCLRNEELNNLAYRLGTPLNQEVHNIQELTGVFFEQVKEMYTIWMEEGITRLEPVSLKGNDYSLIINSFEFEDILFFVVKDESFQERIKQLLTTQQQMEVVSQVAAGVAHELRNPLSVIKGFLQLSKLSDNIEKYYGTIFTEIDRMNKIIEDFLSVSRKKIDKHFFKTKELMESLLMIFRSECLLHDIELSYSFNKEDTTLYINEQMIKQVLLNILRNSIEAYEGQKENRVFKVKTKLTDDTFQIDLEDQGPGIPPEILARIDEPFFTTKEKGTGIGIPLCQHIIEEHHGEFKVISEVGKGTTVSIFLPIS